tara:strand:- start:13397 stop:14410 length:1014 start_codon:yes stop_codon:yes gene_type:complete
MKNEIRKALLDFKKKNPNNFNKEAALTDPSVLKMINDEFEYLDSSYQFINNFNLPNSFLDKAFNLNLKIEDLEYFENIMNYFNKTETIFSEFLVYSNLKELDEFITNSKLNFNIENKNKLNSIEIDKEPYSVSCSNMYLSISKGDRKTVYKIHKKTSYQGNLSIKNKTGDFLLTQEIFDKNFINGHKVIASVKDINDNVLYSKIYTSNLELELPINKGFNSIDFIEIKNLLNNKTYGYFLPLTFPEGTQILCTVLKKTYDDSVNLINSHLKNELNHDVFEGASDFNIKDSFKDIIQNLNILYFHADFYRPYILIDEKTDFLEFIKEFKDGFDLQYKV